MKPGILPTCLIAAIFSACHEKPPAKCNTYACETLFDTQTAKPLRCGLYKDAGDVVAFKTQRLNDKTERWEPFYLTMVLTDTARTAANQGFRDMGAIVDTATFRILGAYDMADKNHVYTYTKFDGGGFIQINLQADPKTYAMLENDYFAKDAHHCYYKGAVVKEADYATFHALSARDEDAIAYDRNHYYNGPLVMDSKEIRKRKLPALKTLLQQQ